MTNSPVEPTAIEKLLVDRITTKVKKECPRCKNRSFEFRPFHSTDPFFVLYCKNCGFKLEHLADFLLDEGEDEQVANLQEGEL